MKKNTFISLLVVLSLATHTYGTNYIIKLASYTNKDRLLTKIDLLDIHIKENITVLEENNLFKLFSKYSLSKEESLKLLPSYQKIFTDAYIMVDTYNHPIQPLDINLSLSLQKESNNSIQTRLSIEPTNGLMYPTIDNKPRLSLQEILENKTYYLSPQSIQSKSEKILIKATFTKNFVTYKTLIGAVPSMQKHFTIQKNRLYLINNNKISISQFSTIDKILFEYIIVSRWFKGKKIHQMRYYKNEEDARSYVQSIKLD